MTLKEFIETHQVEGFIIVENNLILSVVTNNIEYGLDVDTSSITMRTPVLFSSNFTIEDNILEVEGLTLNIETTTLL